MPVASPVQNDSLALTLAISVNEEAFDSDKIVSVEVWSAVNRIPRARLVVNDGDPAKQTFPLSGAETFLPGKKVVISAGYGGHPTTIFTGLVVKHSLEIEPFMPSRLVVEMSDEALKMTLQRKNAVHKGKSDNDVIGALIAGNGLSLGKNEAPRSAQEALVQYHASDWDMLLTRADTNGLVVIVDGGQVAVVAPDTSEQPVLNVEYGDSLLAFDAGIDAVNQLPTSAAKSRSWSYTTQEVVEGAASDKSIDAPGNVAVDALAKVFGLTAFSRQSAAMLPKEALDSWSSGDLLRARLARVCGRVRFQGSAAAKPGKMIELAGLGPRFNGKAYVSGVSHVISDSRWLTTAEFGLPASRFASETANISDPPAAGQLPPVQGLQIGLVKQVSEDPDGNHRVLVTLPLLSGETDGVWARLGGIYASSGFGVVFYPEVGDEVVLGFMSEDPRSPVILGSLYSSKRAPTYPPNAENDKKALVTRSKLEVTFDDKDKIIQIKTPGGHTVTLDDKVKEITLKDSNNNSVVLGKNGITIDSASAITMTAKTNIKISAGANLSLEATANASLKAVKIAEEASAQYSMKACAMAELKSDGILTVQGVLVKIN